MGRGSSKAGGGGGQKPTNARATENMNEAQLNKEISAIDRRLATLQRQRQQIVPSSMDNTMREAFPLGSGGLKREQAERLAGRLAEQSASKGRKLENIINEQDGLIKRREAFERARKEVKGTGKTQSELAAERAAREAQAASGRKWTTVSKAERTGSSYKPKVIRSGDYEIRGTTVFYQGKEYARFGNLKTAKAAVERHARTHGKITYQ